MGLARDIFGGIGTGLMTVALFGGAPLLGLAFGAADLEQQILVRSVDAQPMVWVAGTPGPESVAVAPEVDTPAPQEAPAAAPSASGVARSEVSLTVVSSGGSGARRAESVAHVTEAAPKRKGRRCEPDAIPEIDYHGASMWSVDRSLIRGYTGNLGKLNALGWSRQHDGADGKADGMLIGGIRCNNDLHRAGLRSGDVVHAVNGHKVKNIPQALLAYTAVRNDRVIRVEITRDGAPQTLTYRLTG